MGMMNQMKYTALFILLFVTTTLLGQEKGPVKEINGAKYHVHNVTKGSTLYAISKLYNVELDDIIAANPELKNGLKPGQILQIPLEKVELLKPDEVEVLPPNMFLHEVQQGETLFSLSKKYGVSVREIIDNNPFLIDGLKTGQKLKFHKPKDVESEEEFDAGDQTESADELVEPSIDNFIFHTVVSGDTYYSLSKKYQVPMGDIQKFNPEAKDGLKLGQVLKIPQKSAQEIQKEIKPEQIKETSQQNDVISEVYPASVKSNLPDTIILKDSYQVALLLPFYLNLNDTIEKNKKNFEKETIYPKSSIAIQFYQGVLLALDSLKKTGLSLQLHVFDTQNDTAVVSKWIKDNEKSTFNLIIGPLYKTEFEMVSDYAKRKKIPVVTPVPQTNKVLLGNNYACKVSSSKFSHYTKMAEFVKKEFKSQNVFLVDIGDEKDNQMIELFMNKVKQIEKVTQDKDTVRRVLFGKISAERIKLHLDTSKINVVIIPTSDQAFVSEFLAKLNLASKDYKCVVIGNEKWNNFDNIDSDYLHNLNVHTTAPFHIDYDDKFTLKFLKSFRNSYLTEPDMYGFLGYDVSFYYLKVMQLYGENFLQYIDEYEYNGLATSFKFFKTAPESGFENDFVYILKYENYKQVRVE
jgi:LysM repeat protein/ABC-type branched-subunit amino acid transport system substrate-binding protein